MTTTWKDPISAFDPEKPVEEVVTNDYLSPQSQWDATRAYNVPTYPVGRLRYYHKWGGHGEKLWTRLRYWPTRRRVLDISGAYNTKTLRRQKTIEDKRPIWWIMALAALAIAPFFIPENQQNALLAAGAVFGIYAAINLCWMLIIGTAGIYSLATYAVVGAAAYGTAYLSIHLGLPWWAMPLIGSVIGLIFGVVIAIPATRLDGFSCSASSTASALAACCAWRPRSARPSPRRPASITAPPASRCF